MPRCSRAVRVGKPGFMWDLCTARSLGPKTEAGKCVSNRLGTRGNSGAGDCTREDFRRDSAASSCQRTSLMLVILAA